MGGRDGHTNLGSKGEVEGGSNDSADHAQHEQGGGLVEGVDVDNLCPDGIGDTTTDTDGASEF